jgi:hypothetical protein
MNERLNSSLVPLITSRHGPHRKQLFLWCSSTIVLLRICCLATGVVLLFFFPREHVYRSDAQLRPWYSLQYRGCCIATPLHATLYYYYYYYIRRSSGPACAVMTGNFMYVRCVCGCPPSVQLHEHFMEFVLKSNERNSKAAHICPCLSFVSLEEAFVHGDMKTDVLGLLSVAVFPGS